MGYRHYIGFIPKHTHKEIKKMTISQLTNYLKDDTLRPYSVSKEVFEIGKYVTLDQQADDLGGELVTVFKDGKVTKEYTLEEIRTRSSESI